MLVPYLAIWLGAVASAVGGCLPVAVILGVVLIVIIFRHELLNLFSHDAPAATDSS